MNKKGLIGKILLGIAIVIVLILIVVGVSAYQASKVVKTLRVEGAKTQTNIRLLAEQKDCSKLSEIEISLDKIEKETTSACKNPIIKISVGSIKDIPIKCETLSELKSDVNNIMSKAKIYCNDVGRINESSMNVSINEEELMALAQKYGIQI